MGVLPAEEISRNKDQDDPETRHIVEPGVNFLVVNSPTLLQSGCQTLKP